MPALPITTTLASTPDVELPEDTTGSLWVVGFSDVLLRLGLT